MSEHIKINDTAPWVGYAGDGTTTIFAVPFPFLADTDLSVWVDGAAASEGVDFAATGAGDTAGGSVTMTSAPASGAVVTITRSMAISRTSDFLAGNALQADALNTELDRLTMVAQEAQDALDRTLRAPAHDAGSVGVLPVGVDRADRLLSFDANGDPEAGPQTSVLDQVASISSNAAAASASATSAEASAAAAQLSADDAADDAAEIVALVQNIPALTTATGDGATVSFALGQLPVDEAALLVTLDGVVQHLSAYSLSGSNLVFASAPGGSAAIEVRDLSSTAIIDAADVAALAAVDGDISTVAGIAADVTTVAADAADIGAVATAIADVSVVATDLANVSAVAGDLTDINAVAADEADIGIVATNIADVNAVGAAIANVSLVGGSIANVGTVAANIADVDAYTSRYALALFRAEHPDLPVPTKAFTFYDGVSGSEFAVDRASTANVRFDPQRVLQEVAADSLRYTHDPATGEPSGIRVEPQTSNLFTRSEAFDHADWTKASLTVTADDLRAPDGTTTAEHIEAASTGTLRGVTQARTLTLNKQHVAAWFVRKDTARYWMIQAAGMGITGDSVWFDLDDGEVETQEAGIDGAGIQHVGGGWYRIWAIFTPLSGTTNLATLCMTDTDNSDTATAGLDGWVWGAHLAQSCVLMDYVKTTSTQITVDGDFFDVDPSSEDWFASEAQEGTLFVDVDAQWLRYNQGIIYIRSGGDAGFFIRCATNGSSEVEGNNGAAAGESVSIRATSHSGPFSGDISAATRTLGRHRIAFAWDRTEASLSIDGETVVSKPLISEVPTTFDTLRFGTGNVSDPGSVSTYREAAYWSSKLSDADLELLTTL